MAVYQWLVYHKYLKSDAYQTIYNEEGKPDKYLGTVYSSHGEDEESIKKRLIEGGEYPSDIRLVYDGDVED